MQEVIKLRGVICCTVGRGVVGLHRLRLHRGGGHVGCLRRLLDGRKVSLKGFTSRKGGTFDAALVIDKDKGVAFDFGQRHQESMDMAQKQYTAQTNSVLIQQQMLDQQRKATADDNPSMPTE